MQRDGANSCTCNTEAYVKHTVSLTKKTGHQGAAEAFVLDSCMVTRAYLPDVLAFALLQVCQKILKGYIVPVLPMILNAGALQVANFLQASGLLCGVERKVQAGYAELICDTPQDQALAETQSPECQHRRDCKA